MVMSRDGFINLKNNNMKKVTVFEKVKTEVDTATGEVLSETKEVVNKTSKEPDFIKIYYERRFSYAITTKY